MPRVLSSQHGRRPKPAGVRTEPPPRARRLTYKEQRELESLPQRIETLETELRELHKLTADPAFYRKPAAEVVRFKGRLESLQREVAAGKNWKRPEFV
jgi:ABC transport system ATP-binding/permease protein